MKKPLLIIGLVATALLAPVARSADTSALAFSFASSFASASAVASASVASSVGEARVIVKYRSDSSLLRKQAQSSRTGGAAGARAQTLGARIGTPLRVGMELAERTELVHARGISSSRLASRLAAEPDVEYAVVDQRRRAFNVPNDPLYLSAEPTQAAAGGPAAGQWYLRAPNDEIRSAINAVGAWADTTASGNPGIVVAVLDTGVRFDHPDLLPVALGGNLLPGYDFVSDPVYANDGGGRDADPSDPGDWVDASDLNGPNKDKFLPNPDVLNDAGCTEEPSSWHGTQVAGLIGATTDNGIGMASVGRRVKVLPVRVLGKCGGYDSDIIAGMRWAAGLRVLGVPDNPTPARVINLSLGSEGACSAAYRDAILHVNAARAVVVVSAGNSAGHAVNSPANCPGAIGVAGLRQAGTKVGYSDLGPEIAISAPGGNCVNIATGTACLYPILTTSNKGTTVPLASSAGGAIYTDSYKSSLGTSFAAPLVSGTVGLMLALQPAFSPAEVRGLLQLGARPFPSTGGDAGEPGSVAQCTAPRVVDGKPVDQDQCYCTTSTCGAGMTDSAAAVAAVASGARIELTHAPARARAEAPLQLSLSTVGLSLNQHQWAIVDGGGIVTGFTSASNATTAELTPRGAGHFTVAVTVADAVGASHTFNQTIEVLPATAAAGSGDSSTGSGGGGAMGLGWLLWVLAAVVALRNGPHPPA